jgi:hypothetical protein
VSDETETHLISSSVAYVHMASPSLSDMEIPPLASTRVEPSPETDTSAIRSCSDDFQRSRPFWLRRNTTCWVDPAATVEPSRETATRMPLLPVL